MRIFKVKIKKEIPASIQNPRKKKMKILKLI